MHLGYYLLKKTERERELCERKAYEQELKVYFILKTTNLQCNIGTVNFQMFKLVLEKAEEPEIKLSTSAGS